VCFIALDVHLCTSKIKSFFLFSEFHSDLTKAQFSQLFVQNVAYIQIITHIKYYIFLNDIFFIYILHVHLCIQYNKIFWGP